MGHVDVVRLLLAWGADPALSNSQGNNALDVALEARNLLGRPEVLVAVPPKHVEPCARRLYPAQPPRYTRNTGACILASAPCTQVSELIIGRRELSFNPSSQEHLRQGWDPQHASESCRAATLPSCLEHVGILEHTPNSPSADLGYAQRLDAGLQYIVLH